MLLFPLNLHTQCWLQLNQVFQVTSIIGIMGISVFFLSLYQSKIYHSWQKLTKDDIQQRERERVFPDFAVCRLLTYALSLQLGIPSHASQAEEDKRQIVRCSKRVSVTFMSLFILHFEQRYDFECACPYIANWELTTSKYTFEKIAIENPESSNRHSIFILILFCKHNIIILHQVKLFYIIWCKTYLICGHVI